MLELKICQRNADLSELPTPLAFVLWPREVRGSGGIPYLKKYIAVKYIPYILVKYIPWLGSASMSKKAQETLWLAEAAAQETIKLEKEAEELQKKFDCLKKVTVS